MSDQLDQLRHELQLFQNRDQQIHTETSLIQQSVPASLQSVFQQLSIGDLHVLAKIAQGEQRISEIVAQSDYTQGAISKMISRFVKADLVTKFQKSGNRKDTYLKLTAAGETLNQAHEKAHQLMDQRYREAGSHYTDRELLLVTKVIQDFNRVRRE